jgi:hypothetical protein
MINDNHSKKVKAEMEKNNLVSPQDAVKSQYPEFRTNGSDSFIFPEDIKKSDEVFLFQSKLEL